MRSKKVSVIIPVYNAGQYIEECVGSIIHQEEVGELLIVDDGSTDKTLSVISALAQDNEKIKVLSHGEGINKGPGVSRNLALSQAQEEFVNFLDADDYCLENRFISAIDYLEKNQNIDGIYQSIKLVNKEGNDQDKEIDDFALTKEVEPQDALECILLNTYGTVQLGGFTYRRKFLHENNIKFTHHRVGEDLNVIFESCIKGKVFLSTGSPKLMRRRHDNNLSDNHEQKKRDMTEITSKWFQEVLVKDFSKKSNKYFVRKYLQYNAGGNSKWSKVKMLLKEILSNPKLLFKLL